MGREWPEPGWEGARRVLTKFAQIETPLGTCSPLCLSSNRAADDENKQLKEAKSGKLLDSVKLDHKMYIN